MKAPLTHTYIHIHEDVVTAIIGTYIHIHIHTYTYTYMHIQEMSPQPS